MSNQVTLSRDGRVVLPKEILNRLGLIPGDQLELIERSGGLLLRKLARQKSGESFEEITARIHATINYEGPALPVEELGWPKLLD